MNNTRLPPHYRWNFGVFLTDYVCFMTAMSFINVSSVLPAFAGQLTDSAPVIGLVSTIFQGGWMLPQLATARLINDKPRKKPYMLTGLIGRVMFWVIALALWAGLARYPKTMLILFFVCFGLFATLDGFASVPWFDILARSIPLKQRGRLVGTAQFLGGLTGSGVGALVGLILDRNPFPHNYALLLTLTGISLLPSSIALILIREPPPNDADSQAESQPSGGWLHILIDDSNFRRLILSRLLVGMMMLTSSFYVVHASNVLHLPQSAIGGFVVAQTSAGIVASVVLGLISDRWGPRYVARIGSGAAAVGPLFALLVHLSAARWLTRAYPLVYAALGVVNSTWMMGFTNYLLEIAPEKLRPAYVGLSNTILGVLMLAPIIGGWLLETTSYTTLFSVTTVMVGIGFLLTLGLKPSVQITPPEGQA